MSKSAIDLARGWFRKGDSDLENAQMCLSARKSLDTACFHCQQAAEKWLKAYLIQGGISFPLSHDLSRLLEVCASKEGEFSSLRDSAAFLNPYAVVMRYDAEFWPDEQAVADAIEAARTFRTVITRYAAVLSES